MSHARKKSHEVALRELVEEARRSGESRSAPRRHHLVPVFYLKQWADDGKIRMTDIDKGKSWITSPKRAASETDYYRIESPDLDPEGVPPLLFEVVLSKIERWGADFIASVIDDPVTPLHDDETRVLFSHYMALQYVRGRNYRNFARASMADMFKLTYEDITDEGIRQELRERGLDPNPENMALFRSFVDQLNRGDVTVGPQQASVIGMSAQVAEEVGWDLFARGWHVYQVPEILLDLRRAGNSHRWPSAPTHRTRGRRQCSRRHISADARAAAGHVRRCQRRPRAAVRTRLPRRRST